MKNNLVRISVIVVFMIILTLAGCSIISDHKNTSVVDGQFMFYKDIPNDVEYLKGIPYEQVDGRDVVLSILRTKDKSVVDMPVVVWIHGGGWDAGSNEEDISVFSSFVQNGYLVASIEYRFSSEKTFPAQLEDCKTAIRFLRAHAKEYGIDTNRIGCWGSSAGGHLASLLGVTGEVAQYDQNGQWDEYSSTVQAVCDWYGPTDLTQEMDSISSQVTALIGETIENNRQLYERASVIPYIHEGIPPFLIMHGDKDSVVPITQSEILFTALKKVNADVEYHVITNAGHGFTGIEPFQMVLDFFNQHLK